MKWLKRRLQDWLGITALELRVRKLDHYGEAGFTAIYHKGVPVDIDIDDSTGVAEYGGLDPAPVGTLDTMIKKGYDKNA